MTPTPILEKPGSGNTNGATVRPNGRPFRGTATGRQRFRNALQRGDKDTDAATCRPRSAGDERGDVASAVWRDAAILRPRPAAMRMSPSAPALDAHLHELRA